MSDGTGAASQRLGRLVRQSREQYGWTQTELAERVNEHGFSWHQSTVNRLETGQRTISVDELVTLAAVLGFRLTELVDDEEQAILDQLAELKPQFDQYRYLLAEMTRLNLRLVELRGADDLTLRELAEQGLPPPPKKKRGS